MYCYINGIPDIVCNETELAGVEDWVCSGLRTGVAPAAVPANGLAAHLAQEITGALFWADKKGPPEESYELLWAWELQRGADGKASLQATGGHATVYYVHARRSSSAGFALTKCTHGGCVATRLGDEVHVPLAADGDQGEWVTPVGERDLDGDGDNEIHLRFGNVYHDEDVGHLRVVEPDGTDNTLGLWSFTPTDDWSIADGCAIDDTRLLLVTTATEHSEQDTRTTACATRGLADQLQAAAGGWAARVPRRRTSRSAPAGPGSG